MDNMERLRIIQRVSLVTLIINIVLAAAKVTIGLIYSFTSVISDGVHTVSDIATTIAVMIGVKFASRAADKGHPYGHERAETVTALLLGIALLATAVFIMYTAVTGMINPEDKAFVVDFAIVITAISIVSKEAMYHYTAVNAKKTGSAALRADAWHHRSDALSSVAVLIGLVFVYFGFNIAENIVTVAVALLIIWQAFKIIKSSAGQMLDEAADPQLIEKVRECILSVEGVAGIESLKTRKYADMYFVDLDIYLPEDLTLEKAHAISHEVHDRLEAGFKIKHVQIHCSPAGGGPTNEENQGSAQE